MNLKVTFRLDYSVKRLATFSQNTNTCVDQSPVRFSESHKLTHHLNFEGSMCHFSEAVELHLHSKIPFVANDCKRCTLRLQTSEFPSAKAAKVVVAAKVVAATKAVAVAMLADCSANCI